MTISKNELLLSTKNPSKELVQKFEKFYAEKNRNFYCASASVN